MSMFLTPADLRQYLIDPNDCPVYKPGEYPQCGDPAGVYMLCNDDGLLLYVGQSKAIGSRVLTHWWASRRGERQPFTGYSYIPVCDDFRPLIESAYIHALRPPENVLLAPPLWEQHEAMTQLIKRTWG